MIIFMAILLLITSLMPETQAEWSKENQAGRLRNPLKETAYRYKVKAVQVHINIKAQAELEQSLREFREAKAGLASTSNQIETAINREKTILHESADPAIDEAIEFFRSKLDFLRAPGRITRSSKGSKIDLIHWEKQVKEVTNLPAVQAALAYCRAAIPALEEMKLLPALDTKRIERLKAGIPPIDIFSEVTAERPLERINADPRSMLPSDDAMDWKKNKLLEAAEKLLSRKAG